ncbi:hypothetical protein C4D60_Mb10t24010 [Musa balbisiana]|uniref:Peroxidase n=1 Tax=Musa balbisiana TaxID=52838 RepID=A0A4S8IZH0_MUSBA|nr:hypothetical protein C4D60_Mb10t24010 [Musa balbisiana]
MASFRCLSCSIALCSLIISFVFVPLASAQLSPTFYNTSCPNALSIIRTAVRAAVARDRRMGASLLRLHFHDCFVQAKHKRTIRINQRRINGRCVARSQGCDASLLLDDTSTFTGEKTANPNNNSLRGFEVIDAIKSKLESACKQVVSCADIVAVAARDSVVAVLLICYGENISQLGGPTWTVELGRRDSTTASLSSANTDIPGPTADLRTLISSFSGKGLSVSDMAALSGNSPSQPFLTPPYIQFWSSIRSSKLHVIIPAGAHTIGQARCFLFRARIYNDTNIDPSFASSLRPNCSSSGGDNELSPLDSTTPTEFDNDYYANLVRERGLLHSDQQLFMNGGGSVESQVSSYATNSAKFFSDFASAMVKMGSISPLTGSSGEIRINCRKIN